MPGMGTGLAEGPLRDELVATGARGNCVAAFPLPVEAKNGSWPMPSLLQGYDSTQVRIPMMIEDVVNGAGKAVDTQECRKLRRDVRSA